MRVLLVIVVLVALVGVAILLGGDRLRASFSRPVEPTEVRTNVVVAEELGESVSAPGIVEPHRKVNISAEISARIESLPFREGDRVARGDVVVRLDDRDLVALLQSATARRDADRFRLLSETARLAGPIASLEHARGILERQRGLLESGDASQQTVDDAIQRVLDIGSSVEAMRQSIAVMESSLAAADAEIARAEEALAKTVIISPMDGLVTRLNAEVGELVVVGTMNNPGTVIMTIADLSHMLLQAEVAETDIARVAIGQHCRIHINAYPDDVFTGVVERVDLQRTERAGANPFFMTEVTIDLDGRRILSGVAANVDIEIKRHQGLTVPSQAIVQRPIEEVPERFRNEPLVDRSRRVVPVVFRIVDGVATWTPVRTGPSDLISTLVIDGLTEGDEVITGPFHALQTLADEAAVRREGDPRPDGERPAREPDRDGIEISIER